MRGRSPLLCSDLLKPALWLKPLPREPRKVSAAVRARFLEVMRHRGFYLKRARIEGIFELRTPRLTFLFDVKCAGKPQSNPPIKFSRAKTLKAIGAATRLGIPYALAIARTALVGAMIYPSGLGSIHNVANMLWSVVIPEPKWLKERVSMCSTDRTSICLKEIVERSLYAATLETFIKQHGGGK